MKDKRFPGLLILIFALASCTAGVGVRDSGSGGSTSTAATPSFNPVAGTYSGAQLVSIADSTPGASIYYTTDGTTPTTSSAKFSSAINVSASLTLKAIGAATGYNNSAVASAAYTIKSNTNSYSTVFPLTEDPISENGSWINGGVTGLLWHDCQTTPGFAFGTQPGTTKYDDSACVLTGTWGTNQSAQATIKVNSTNNAQFDEVEVFLNATIAANSITGYEINCSVASANPYMQIVRWNGGLGNFTLINSTTAGCTTGDVLSAARSGNTITAFKNGTAMITVSDTTYTGGSPGMGFYIQTLNGTSAAADAGFGVSAYSAAD